MPKKISLTRRQVLNSSAPIYPRPDFFTGSLTNFAENILYPANVDIDPSSTAIITAWEGGHREVSWQKLRENVQRCALGLRKLGVIPNDRVAGFLGNHEYTVIAMLAATSIGAVWTGVSPDTGVTAVLDRLVQIEPVVLFSDTDVKYNGKIHESLSKTKEITRELKTLKALVIFPAFSGSICEVEGFQVGNGIAWKYNDFLEEFWYVFMFKASMFLSKFQIALIKGLYALKLNH